jgi:hypothetical protein
MLDATGYVSGFVDSESLAQRKYFEREFLSIWDTHVHLNRYVVRHYFTGKHAVPFYAIVTCFSYLLYHTVSETARPAARFTFLDTHIHPIHLLFATL